MKTSSMPRASALRGGWWPATWGAVWGKAGAGGVRGCVREGWAEKKTEAAWGGWAKKNEEWNEGKVEKWVYIWNPRKGNFVIIVGSGQGRSSKIHDRLVSGIEAKYITRNRPVTSTGRGIPARVGAGLVRAGGYWGKLPSLVVLPKYTKDGFGPPVSKEENCVFSKKTCKNTVFGPWILGNCVLKNPKM